MTLSPFDILMVLGAAQGLFVAFLLYRRKVSNRSAANYLLALVFLVSMLLFTKLSFNPEWVVAYGAYILLPDAILYIFGPCLWLFVRHLLRLPPLERHQLWLHSIPALFHILVLNTVLGQHLSQNWQFLSVNHIIFAYYVIEGGAIVSLTTYILASYKMVQAYQKKLKPLNISPAAARFLPTFFRIGLVLTGCWGASFLYHIIVFDPYYTAYQIFWFLLVTYVYWLAYVVLLKTELFDLPPAPKTITLADEGMIKQIQAYMKVEKPYLEPSLKLGDMAEALDIPRHELSKLLNHGFGQSFFDFINTYRICAFIELWNDSDETTILQLAYQVGFNSKSAFNRAFRKIKGTSPSDFFSGQPIDHIVES
ncbi:MAG: transcriptional regulator [Saprospiraceae bacterium]|nr:MAG: transcriptional regulator [Saprospiraceae bacterium]